MNGHLRLRNALASLLDRTFMKAREGIHCCLKLLHEVLSQKLLISDNIYRA